jgi:histone deacetylase 1/2
MQFWQYAFQSATFLINRMPSKVLNNDSPYYTLFHKIPKYKSFRVFGCLCYPFIRPYNSHKLQYISLQCVFLGYNFQNKGYLCLDPLTGRVYVTPHVVFDETKFLDTTPSLTRDSPAEILTPAILPFPSSLPTDISHSPPQSALPFPSDSTRSMSGSTSTPVSHSEPASIPEDQDTCSAPAPRMTT